MLTEEIDSRFNQERIKILIDGMPEPKKTDKPVYLVMGNTGSGKSTLVNYMLGHQMIQKETEDGETVVDTADTSTAKIGHTMDSETLYAEIFDNGESRYAYCDCPGFSENRGEEESICETISIELAIKSSKIVKGIVICCSYAEFTKAASRGEGFKNLVKSLYKMFKDPSKIENTISLAITHIPPGLSEEECKKQVEIGIKQNIKSLDGAYARIIEKLKRLRGTGLSVSDETALESAGMIALMKLLQHRPQIMVPVYPLDHGATRRNIETIIERSSAIDENEFDFKTYSQERNEFDESVFKKIDNLNKQLKRIMALPMEISKCNEEIKFLHQTINTLERKIQLVSEKSDEAVIGEELQLVNIQDSDEKNLRLSELKEALESKKAYSCYIFDKRMTMERDRTIKLYWEQSAYAAAHSNFWVGYFKSWCGIGALVNKNTKFSYQHSDVPLHSVDKSTTREFTNLIGRVLGWDPHAGCTFRDENQNLPRGMYSVICNHIRHFSYDQQGDHFLPSQTPIADVKGYVEARNIPANKIIISNIIDELRTIEDDIKNYEYQIETLQQEIRANQMQSTIKSLNEKLKKNKFLLEVMASKLQSLETENRDLLQNMAYNQTDLDNTYKMMTTLNYENVLVKEFLRNKEQYERIPRPPVDMLHQFHYHGERMAELARQVQQIDLSTQQGEERRESAGDRRLFKPS